MAGALHCPRPPVPLSPGMHGLCSANAAFMMVLHAKSANASEAAGCLQWARRQVDYMLGLAGSDRWAGKRWDA